MFQSIKRALFFPMASYFRFFAEIKLARWNPRIIVITGSSGKTTTMNLVESQLKNEAVYSHHANSAIGIPFNILGLERKTLLKSEWISLIINAPLFAFSKLPKQNIYVVEADCDRPGEGKFITESIKPEVTIWLSSSRTHSMNFDHLVDQQEFETVEEAIAYEYGYFLENTKNLVIVNADSNLIMEQIGRTKAKILKISENKTLKKYKITKSGTEFQVGDEEIKLDILLPRAVYSSIDATFELCKYLRVKLDPTFANFKNPPGRSSIFEGIKQTTIIDSTYNLNLFSASEIINMFNSLPGSNKWAVIGDILEQGNSEKEEHEKLAKLIVESNYQRVVLLGPRIKKWGFELLQHHYKENVVHFDSPKDVLEYIKNNITGGELILFKGARFLEGVIEHLLVNNDDVNKLSRREKVWEIRRKEWGL